MKRDTEIGNDIDKVIIKGNQPVFGTVYLSGDPISAMFNILLGAMYKEKFSVTNVPRSNVILGFLNILQQIGYEVAWINENSLQIKGKEINNDLTEVFGIDDYDFYEHLLIPLMLKKTLSCYVKSSSRGVIKFYRKFGFDVNINLEDNRCHIHIPPEIKFEKSFDVRESFGTIIASRLLLKEVIEEMHVIYNENDVRFHQIDFIKSKPSKKNITIKSSYNQVEFNLFASIGAISSNEVTIKNFDLAQSLQYLLSLNDIGVQYEVSDENSLKIWRESYKFKDEYDYSNRTMSEVAFLLILFSKFLEKPTQVLVKYFDGLDEFVKSINMIGGRITYVGNDDYSLLRVNPADISPVKISLVDESWNAMHILSGVIANGNTVLDNFRSISDFIPNLIDNLSFLHVDIKPVKS